MNILPDKGDVHIKIFEDEMFNGCKNLNCPKPLKNICSAQTKRTGEINCSLLYEHLQDIRGYKKNGL